MPVASFHSNIYPGICIISLFTSILLLKYCLHCSVTTLGKILPGEKLLRVGIRTGQCTLSKMFQFALHYFIILPCVVFYHLPWSVIPLICLQNRPLYMQNKYLSLHLIIKYITLCFIVIMISPFSSSLSLKCFSTHLAF